jgi:hypothetical protein
MQKAVSLRLIDGRFLKNALIGLISVETPANLLENAIANPVCEDFKPFSGTIFFLVPKFSPIFPPKRINISRRIGSAPA